MARPLMPKATAVWLVENTTLTFDQIAAFCGLHPLEVQGIADGEVAVGIVGRDPLAAGELTREEIARCEADKSQALKMAEAELPVQATRSGPKYTPVSKRQNRPDAISWLIKYHPELSDAQVCRLVGTTKPTVNAVRDRTHWNTPNIKPQDPVSLGMCSQTELDEAIATAVARQRRKEDAARKAAIRRGEVVPEPAPVEEPPVEEPPAEEPAEEERSDRAINADDVFEVREKAPAEPANEPDIHSIWPDAGTKRGE